MGMGGRGLPDGNVAAEIKLRRLSDFLEFILAILSLHQPKCSQSLLPKLNRVATESNLERIE